MLFGHAFSQLLSSPRWGCTHIAWTDALGASNPSGLRGVDRLGRATGDWAWMQESMWSCVWLLVKACWRVLSPQLITTGLASYLLILVDERMRHTPKRLSGSLN